MLAYSYYYGTAKLSETYIFIGLWNTAVYVFRARNIDWVIHLLLC